MCIHVNLHWYCFVYTLSAGSFATGSATVCTPVQPGMYVFDVAVVHSLRSLQRIRVLIHAPADVYAYKHGHRLACLVVVCIFFGSLSCLVPNLTCFHVTTLPRCRLVTLWPFGCPVQATSDTISTPPTTRGLVNKCRVALAPAPRPSMPHIVKDARRTPTQ